MPRKEILYFESAGEINTDTTLKIALERGDELGIKEEELIPHVNLAASLGPHCTK